MFKWQILLHRNYKLVTVHNESSKIQPSTSVHFAARVRSPRVVRLSWSSPPFTRATASNMRARNWSSPPFTRATASNMRARNSPGVPTFFFVNFAIHPTQPTDIWRSEVWWSWWPANETNISVSVTTWNCTYVHVNFLITVTNNITLQDTDLSSSTTLYTCKNRWFSELFFVLYTTQNRKLGLSRDPSSTSIHQFFNLRQKVSLIILGFYSPPDGARESGCDSLLFRWYGCSNRLNNIALLEKALFVCEHYATHI